MVNGEDLLEKERFSQLAGHLTAQGPRSLDDDDRNDDDGDHDNCNIHNCPGWVGMFGFLNDAMF